MHERLAYCTNVHPGRDLETTQAALAQHTLEVKSRFSPDSPMGVGLWLSAQTVGELSTRPARLEDFAEWLDQHGLVPCTLNGFPYGDFHDEVVKLAVYRPEWWDADRADYTIRLANTLDLLLPAGKAGTISTLPIGWPVADDMESRLAQAAIQLEGVVQHLHELHESRQRRIVLCLEPEPGCILDTSQDVVDFFERYLWPRRSPDWWSGHLGVCHDICHSAVMFEPQAEAIETYRQHNIPVGKVQVSAAVRMWLEGRSEQDRFAARAELAEFDEPRYLHQTVWRSEAGATEFFEDLPLALADARGLEQSEWRTHFHVPIFLRNFGALESTQDEIDQWMAEIGQDEVIHYEVETYAWSVLPEELQVDSLADGIAREMAWAALRVMPKMG